MSHQTFPLKAVASTVVNASRIHRRTLAAFATLCVLSAPVLSATPPDTEEPVVVNDRRAARAIDIAIIAEDKGWAVDETELHMSEQDAFGDLLNAVNNDNPESFAGGEFATQPGGMSYIYFKGPVPAGAPAMVDESGLWVELIGGRKYSAAQLRDRSVAVVKLLAADGYQEVVSAVLASGLIAVTVRTQPDDNPQLPPEFLDGVLVTTVDGPIGQTHHTRGGARISIGPGPDRPSCTTGFSVSSLTTGTNGVSTAAHCGNLVDTYEQPSGEGEYSATYRAGHEGALGDMQWHTSAHIELAEYYASPTDLREVNSVEPWGAIAVNNTYCVYSRMTATRSCDQVYSDFVNHFFSSGGFVSSLVGMDDNIPIEGDSGGPWSFGTEATGLQRGATLIWFKARAVFSVAELLPAALGVAVMLQ